jgi:hypothetical protein
MYSTTSLIALIVVILFFLFCREIICWYFKINQIVDLMHEISDKLDFQSPPTVRIPKQGDL